MYHLDIPKTRQYDHGKVEVIARSSVGETRTETTITVKQRSDDYRGVLKNSPRRKFTFRLSYTHSPMNSSCQNGKLNLTEYKSIYSIDAFNGAPSI